MKKLIALAAAVGLLATAPAGAMPYPRWAGPGNFSHNVNFIRHVPTNNDTAGGRILGSHFYLTTSNSLRIYDITTPKDPQLLSVLPRPQTPYFAQEDVDTNGRILLIGNSVIDVTDKENPSILSTHTVSSHTISCVLDCTWAYGSEGQIVDLRNPASPVVSPLRWGAGKPTGSGHDVTEVAPGLVVTSSDPVMLLDAREDPERPVLLAQSMRRSRFVHGNLWPNQMTDRWLLVGGETAGPTCNGASAHFVTMDTQGWEDGPEPQFTQVDEYRVQNGLPTNGDAPADLFCAHWFDTHPSYRNGGLVAMAWYEHGTRFLEISDEGKITEVGWFIPAGGSTSGAYWATKSVVYATDYNRGFDIIEFDPRTSKLPI